MLRCYNFAAPSLAWFTSQRVLLVGIQDSTNSCNEHKVQETASKLYVTTTPGFKKQVGCVC